MVKMLTVTGALILCSCIADIRPAIRATHDHVRAIKTIVRAEHVSAKERLVLVDFHVVRTEGWTTAMLRHKGEPPPENRVTIPMTPDDKREIEEEIDALEEYNADIDLEESLKGGAKGWLSAIVGGGAITGLTGALALFMRYKKKVIGVIRGKDRAIDQYDRALDTLPKVKRVAVGKGADLQHEHAARRNGGEA